MFADIDIVNDDELLRVLNLQESEGHGDEAEPDIRDGEVQDQQISVNIILDLSSRILLSHLAFLRLGRNITATITNRFSRVPTEI